MADDKQGRAFYERREFKGVVAVLGLVTAILAIVGPLRSVIGELVPDPSTPTLNAQVIFDTSAAMGKPFHGKEERREASLEALRSSRFWPSEGVGLRGTDPICGEGSGDPLVPLGIGHVDEVQAAAAEQEPEGKSNLVAAVFAALSEFAEPPYSDDPALSKRVIVFSAGIDECSEDPVGELEHLLKGSGVNRAKSEFKLFGLNASPREKQQLNGLKAALESAGAYTRVWTPRRPEQLYRGVEEMNKEAEARPGLPEPEVTVPADG
jgi:hypothetical protein